MRAMRMGGRSLSSEELSGLVVGCEVLGWSAWEFSDYGSLPVVPASILIMVASF